MFSSLRKATATFLSAESLAPPTSGSAPVSISSASTTGKDSSSSYVSSISSLSSAPPTSSSLGSASAQQEQPVGLAVSSTESLSADGKGTSIIAQPPSSRSALFSGTTSGVGGLFSLLSGGKSLGSSSGGDGSSRTGMSVGSNSSNASTTGNNSSKSAGGNDYGSSGMSSTGFSNVNSAATAAMPSPASSSIPLSSSSFSSSSSSSASSSTVSTPTTVSSHAIASSYPPSSTAPPSSSPVRLTSLGSSLRIVPSLGSQQSLVVSGSGGGGSSLQQQQLTSSSSSRRFLSGIKDFVINTLTGSGDSQGLLIDDEFDAVFLSFQEYAQQLSSLHGTLVANRAHFLAYSETLLGASQLLQQMGTSSSGEGTASASRRESAVVPAQSHGTSSSSSSSSSTSVGAGGTQTLARESNGASGGGLREIMPQPSLWDESTLAVVEIVSPSSSSLSLSRDGGKTLLPSSPSLSRDGGQKPYPSSAAYANDDGYIVSPIRQRVGPPPHSLSPAQSSNAAAAAHFSILASDVAAQLAPAFEGAITDALIVPLEHIMRSHKELGSRCRELSSLAKARRAALDNFLAMQKKALAAKLQGGSSSRSSSIAMLALPSAGGGGAMDSASYSNSSGGGFEATAGSSAASTALAAAGGWLARLGLGIPPPSSKQTIPPPSPTPLGMRGARHQQHGSLGASDIASPGDVAPIHHSLDDFLNLGSTVMASQAIPPPYTMGVSQERITCAGGGTGSSNLDGALPTSSAPPLASTTTAAGSVTGIDIGTVSGISASTSTFSNAGIGTTVVAGVSSVSFPTAYTSSSSTAGGTTAPASSSSVTCLPPPPSSSIAGTFTGPSSSIAGTFTGIASLSESSSLAGTLAASTPRLAFSALGSVSSSSLSSSSSSSEILRSTSFKLDGDSAPLATTPESSPATARMALSQKQTVASVKRADATEKLSALEATVATMRSALLEEMKGTLARKELVLRHVTLALVKLQRPLSLGFYSTCSPHTTVAGVPQMSRPLLQELGGEGTLLHVQSQGGALLQEGNTQRGDLSTRDEGLQQDGLARGPSRDDTAYAGLIEQRDSDLVATDPHPHAVSDRQRCGVGHNLAFAVKELQKLAADTASVTAAPTFTAASSDLGGHGEVSAIRRDSLQSPDGSLQADAVLLQRTEVAAAWFDEGAASRAKVRADGAARKEAHRLTTLADALIRRDVPFSCHAIVAAKRAASAAATAAAAATARRSSFPRDQEGAGALPSTDPTAPSPPSLALALLSTPEWLARICRGLSLADVAHLAAASRGIAECFENSNHLWMSLVRYGALTADSASGTVPADMATLPAGGISSSAEKEEEAAPSITAQHRISSSGEKEEEATPSITAQHVRLGKADRHRGLGGGEGAATRQPRKRGSSAKETPRQRLQRDTDRQVAVFLRSAPLRLRFWMRALGLDGKPLPKWSFAYRVGREALIKSSPVLSSSLPCGKEDACSQAVGRRGYSEDTRHPESSGEATTGNRMSSEAKGHGESREASTTTPSTMAITASSPPTAASQQLTLGQCPPSTTTTALAASPIRTIGPPPPTRCVTLDEFQALVSLAVAEAAPGAKIELHESLDGDMSYQSAGGAASEPMSPRGNTSSSNGSSSAGSLLSRLSMRLKRARLATGLGPSSTSRSAPPRAATADASTVNASSVVEAVDAPEAETSARWASLIEQDVLRTYAERAAPSYPTADYDGDGDDNGDAAPPLHLDTSYQTLGDLVTSSAVLRSLSIHVRDAEEEEEEAGDYDANDEGGCDDDGGGEEESGKGKGNETILRDVAREGETRALYSALDHAGEVNMHAVLHTAADGTGERDTRTVLFTAGDGFGEGDTRIALFTAGNGTEGDSCTALFTAGNGSGEGNTCTAPFKDGDDALQEKEMQEKEGSRNHDMESPPSIIPAPPSSSLSCSAPSSSALARPAPPATTPYRINLSDRRRALTDLLMALAATEPFLRYTQGMGTLSRIILETCAAAATMEDAAAPSSSSSSSSSFTSAAAATTENVATPTPSPSSSLSSSSSSSSSSSANTASSCSSSSSSSLSSSSSSSSATTASLSAFNVLAGLLRIGSVRMHEPGDATPLPPPPHPSLASLFAHDSKSLRHRLAQLQNILAMYLPDLACHLTRQGITADAFATSWFLTLFSDFATLGLAEAAATIDRFLLGGWTEIFEVTIEVLAKMESALLTKDMEGILQTLRAPRASFFLSWGEGGEEGCGMGGLGEGEEGGGNHYHPLQMLSTRGSAARPPAITGTGFKARLRRDHEGGDEAMP